MIGPLSTTYAGDMKLSSPRRRCWWPPILVGSLGRIVVGSLTDRFGGRAMFIAVSLASIGPVLAVERRVGPLLPAAAGVRVLPGRGGHDLRGRYPVRQQLVRGRPTRFRDGVFGMGMVGTALSAFFTPRFVRWFGLFATHVIVAVALAVTAVVCIVVMRNAPASPRTPIRCCPLRAAVKLPVTWEMSFLYAVVFGGLLRSPTTCPPT
jgi:NNP family nitrate/nitrite transporter-like MFS transporter